MTFCRYPVLLSLLIASFIACGDPPPSQYPSQVVHTEDSTLRSGDSFEVRVYRQDEMTAVYEVSSEGTISFPLIGIVAVEGKTPAEVERAIQQRLADGYLKQPSVSVILKESKSKSISVFGEVEKPAKLPFVEGMTVVDAVATAGGFTAMARKNAVSVTRSFDGKKTSYTVPVEDIGKGKANNFYIRPGDIVSVPRRTW